MSHEYWNQYVFVVQFGVMSYIPKFRDLPMEIPRLPREISKFRDMWHYSLFLAFDLSLLIHSMNSNECVMPYKFRSSRTMCCKKKKSSNEIKTIYMTSTALIQITDVKNNKTHEVESYLASIFK
jgi:hypothetical protein